DERSRASSAGARCGGAAPGPRRGRARSGRFITRGGAVGGLASRSQPRGVPDARQHDRSVTDRARRPVRALQLLQEPRTLRKLEVRRQKPEVSLKLQFWLLASNFLLVDMHTLLLT